MNKLAQWFPVFVCNGNTTDVVISGHLPELPFVLPLEAQLRR